MSAFGGKADMPGDIMKSSENSIDKNFKFNAVQQLRAVVCFNIVSFIFVTP